MLGSTRTKALLASRSIVRWNRQLPSWRKKSRRRPVRSLHRRRKQRPRSVASDCRAPRSGGLQLAPPKLTSKAGAPVSLKEPRRLLRNSTVTTGTGFSRTSQTP